MSKRAKTVYLAFKMKTQGTILRLVIYPTWLKVYNSGKL
ncbi:hypothetical protein BTN50_1092 [Candidatus Enterovibrio altilux]|uniref:Mobile element protein n=1 Tax=Candidatus Enterovibrio altilux TaxID=1927128 RepID=A0A291B9A5_9GAMM|nr:hypothetical protein BTN50_1092 [Candidatus Enterovibrio luxaltus]